VNLVIVGISDCRLSNRPDDALVTYALGSCVAVAIHDPVARVGGLLHIMLPESAIGPEKARQSPFMFVDTGVPLLFRSAYELGAEKRRLTVWIAGGAQVMNDNGAFDIGRRNCLAVRKILWRAGVLIHGEETGGCASRTVRLEVGTGRFWLRGAGETERELAASKRGAEWPSRS